MGKEYIPSERELEKYSELVLGVLKPRAGEITKVTLVPRDMRVDHSKSQIFAANVSYDADKTLTNVPSPLIIKHYMGSKNPRTSGSRRENDLTEFLREITVLGLDIKCKTPFTGDNPVRVYPEAYSVGCPRCNQDCTIIREFVPGDTLEQIAYREKAAEKSIFPKLKNGNGTGELAWESAYGATSVSQFLLPISILHLETNAAKIAEALYARDLIPCKSLGDVKADNITRTRGKRIRNYFSTLVRAKGEEIKMGKEVEYAFFNLDRNLVSKPELITIVDGELDTILHHAMINRIPDAGGVEFGGLARDLAVYGASCLHKLWEPTKIEFAHKVVTTYLNLRSKIEEHVGISPTIVEKVENDSELIAQGVMEAIAFGNLRKSAAVVHYDASVDSKNNERVEVEVTEHLKTAYGWLTALKDTLRGELKENTECLLRFSEKYGLGTKSYRLSPRYTTSINPISLSV